MNDTLIKNCCIWARVELIRGVALRMERYRIDAAADAGLSVVNGRALSPQEIEQRDELLRLVREEGAERLRDRAAYTWFNRIAAVRYMELHDYLPSRVRMFTRPVPGGAGYELGSQAVEEALDVQIEGLDPARVIELKQASDDKALFRYLFLAQCDELSACLPDVFQPLDACMALLLPEHLMEADGVIGKLVNDIPEGEWENVEVLGWMYQFYNAELKADFFNSKRKAAAADIAPATQLFTPEWIVRYMVENSLGRLWMLNHPQSALRERMAYYIEPDAEHEDYLRIASPEDITFCDPACGSGHILSYAFELLFAMYEESGYREREIPELILTKNLAGMEIDERAAQIASLVLALRAREHDRRFFRRDVHANVCVLESIPFEEGELSCCGKPLAEALAHLGEVGSLLAPTEDDLQSLREELANCEGDLFAAAKADKLKLAIGKCEQLSRRFDVVVANPPYMGSAKFNPFMSGWVKKHYPDVKSDLCTCFIERGFSLAKERGYAAMVTMQSWMFLGSFEKMRGNIIANKGIVTMAHLGPHAFDAIGGEVVSVTADVIYNGRLAGEGAYVRLVDINGSEEKRLKLVEAIQNPACGWFYRRDAQTFTQIPGTPIAYWAPGGLFEAFVKYPQLRKVSKPRVGLQTSDNARFLRCWFECESSNLYLDCCDATGSVHDSRTWYPHNKGGSYRKWYGNAEFVVNYQSNGMNLVNADGATKIPDELAFKKAITYSRISSGTISFREQPGGFVFDSAAVDMFPAADDFCSVLGALNSSVISVATEFLTPTLNAQPGDIAKLPIALQANDEAEVIELVNDCVDMSKSDWDSFETSWDFKRHPLL